MLTVTNLTIDQAPKPLRIHIRELLSSPYYRGMVLLDLVKSTYEGEVTYFAYMADADTGIYLQYADDYDVLEQKMNLVVMERILSFVDRRMAV